MRVRGGGKALRWLAVSVLAVHLVAQPAPSARAEDELTKLQQELNRIQQQRQQASNELARLQSEVAEAQKQLELVEVQLNQAQQELDLITTQIAATNQELQRVEAELAETQKRYDQRKELLGRRIRAIHEEGRVSYLAVLLGSTTFGDFISRYDMLKVIVQQDAALFSQVRQDKLALEEKQQQVRDRKDKLEALQARQKEQVVAWEQKRAEREQVSRSLSTRKASLIQQLDAFDREAEAIYQTIWEIQQRQRRQAGEFAPIWPVRQHVITEYFGPRIHPILGVPRQHNGVDLGVPQGTPVYAVESGVVIMAGWNDAYGNLVVIDHGGGTSTWYAHNSKLLVKVGDAVKQGQQISESGNTGWSTGPHLHFELHINGQPVNPLDYLP
jgi:murein DD-endopeptidase MepM/ murein hydrolase activator NlpD